MHGRLTTPLWDWFRTAAYRLDDAIGRWHRYCVRCRFQDPDLVELILELHKKPLCYDALPSRLQLAAMCLHMVKGVEIETDHRGYLMVSLA